MIDLKKLAFVSVVTGAFALGVSPAQAGLVLYLDAGAGNSVTVYDNDAGDDDATLGVINYSTTAGSLGSWWISTTVGVDFSTPSLAKLDLFSVDANSLGGPSTLYIELGLSGIDGPASTSASGGTAVGGTTDGTVSFSTLFNDAVVGSLGPFGSGPSTPFSGSVGFGGLDTTSPFKLTNVATIAHSGIGITSFDMVTTVPEPGALGLLGLGLLGLGFARRPNPV